MTQESLFDNLNERELEVIHLLAEGLSNKEIGSRLYLAVNTVKWYISQINSKLGTINRKEIVERAITLNLLNPSESRKTNLPYSTNSFIGRDADLDALTHIFDQPDIRAVTILAQGGMGKTRLALEFAKQQLPKFYDGVYFIPLQDIQDTDNIIFALAEHTPFFFQKEGRNPQQQLLTYLANKQMLLILDNFEHLLNGAGIINTILESAPDIRILITSREKLNLLSETAYTLDGMNIPIQSTNDEALQTDAVRLLVQSAQRVKPKWGLNADKDRKSVV